MEGIIKNIFVLNMYFFFTYNYILQLTVILLSFLLLYSKILFVSKQSFDSDDLLNNCIYCQFNKEINT